MEVHAKLDEVVELVRAARAARISGYCRVNRGELLGKLDELRRLLPEQVHEAEVMLEDRERIIARAREEAERLVAQGREQQGHLVEESEVLRAARGEAERLLERARQRAARTQADVEDYLDRRLANFEVVLHKTMQAVARGRSQLSGRGVLDELSADDEPPQLPHG